MEQKYQSKIIGLQDRNGNKIRNGDLSRINIESHPLRAFCEIWRKSPVAVSVGYSESQASELDRELKKLSCEPARREVGGREREEKGPAATAAAAAVGLG
jgi:hypothetical protein